MMDYQTYVVQFPHPGGEHRPKADVMPWNTGDHARKFMVAEADYRGDGDIEQHGRVVFWGEWEGPSRVVGRWKGEWPLPTYLHEPYLEKPVFAGSRQNTDPWVFGDVFRYSNCKQRTNKGRTATAMQRLGQGSLILFGSTVEGKFVLDTALVVGKRVGEFGVPSCDLAVDEAFRVATLESLGTLDDMGPETTFTLYEGATPARPLDGMYSFVPCLPYDGPESRFERPIIELPGIINPASTQATKGTSQSRSREEVRRSWESVAQQVLRQDLLLATRLELGRA